MINLGTAVKVSRVMFIRSTWSELLLRTSVKGAKIGHLQNYRTLF